MEGVTGIFLLGWINTSLCQERDYFTLYSYSSFFFFFLPHRESLIPWLILILSVHTCGRWVANTVIDYCTDISARAHTNTIRNPLQWILNYANSLIAIFGIVLYNECSRIDNCGELRSLLTEGRGVEQPVAEQSSVVWLLFITHMYCLFT